MTQDANSPAYVYVLLDPKTHDIRYVGCSETPGLRFKGHISEARRAVRWQRECQEKGRKLAAPSAKETWIHELLEAGKFPLMAIVETTDQERRVEVEERWIAKLDDEGHSLLNIEMRHKRRRSVDIFNEALDLGRKLFDLDS